GRDAVLTARVLQPINGVADRETASAEERAIRKIDPRRQFARRRQRRRGGDRFLERRRRDGLGLSHGLGDRRRGCDDFGRWSLDRSRRRGANDAAMLGLYRRRLF